MELPKDIFDKRAKEAHDQMLSTIKGFYNMGGAINPVEKITDLVMLLFDGLDPEHTDNEGKPIPIFKAYTEHFVQDTMFVTTELIKFIVKLEQDFKDYRQFLRA